LHRDGRVDRGAARASAAACAAGRAAASRAATAAAAAPRRAGWRSAKTTRRVQFGVPQGRGGAPAPGIARGRSPAGPAPRNAAGRVILGGPTPAVKGVWLPGAGGAQDTGDNTPLQPWARALLANRNKFQVEPHTRCKPSGG